MTYLFSPLQIRQSLRNLFSGNEEKWAVVAFVGYGALDQLPDKVSNLSVVCWPKAGATHPDGIRRLLHAGIKVYFCDNLHSKVYWAKSNGMIVGSANLSNNALGESRQHEFAAYLDDGLFDIQTILCNLRYSPVTDDSLRSLDTAHVAAGSRDSDSDFHTQKPPSFNDAMSSVIPKKWKIVCWTENRKDKEGLRNAVYDHSGGRSWANDNDANEGDFEVGDFVLQLHVDEDSYEIKTVNGKWLRVELVTKIDGAKVIVQVKPTKDGPSPPFEIDRPFKKKFKAAFNEAAWEEILENDSSVKREFIEKLLSSYRDV